MPRKYQSSASVYTTTMARVNLNDIIREGRAATRLEKNLLFMDYVCETSCIRVIKLLSEQEINRILALHLFDLHVLQLNRDRGLMIRHIGSALGVSKPTMYRWFPAHAEHKSVYNEPQRDAQTVSTPQPNY